MSALIHVHLQFGAKRKRFDLVGEYERALGAVSGVRCDPAD